MTYVTHGNKITFIAIAIANACDGNDEYCKTSNIRRTLEGNTFFYHSDVVEASPVVAAPTTSSFST